MNKKSLFIILFSCLFIFFLSGLSLATAVYLPGLPSTFYDAEKLPPAQDPAGDDDAMCWAAAASNVLAWTGWHGGGMGDDEDAIFNHFTSHWSNGGSTAEYGWRWWFYGEDSPAEPGAAIPDVSGGGNFYTQAEFNSSYQGWQYDDMTPTGGAFDPDGSDANVKIMDFIDNDYGTVLGIFGEDGAHGITLWGYEEDRTYDGEFGIWVSDSDDNKNVYPAPDELKYYELLLGSQIGSFPNWVDCWFIQDYLGVGTNDYWWIGTVQGLEQHDTTVIPEPTSILLVGAGLLGIIALRRRGRGHK